MRSFVVFLDFVLTVYVWVLLAAAILDWLIGFKAVQPTQPAVTVAGKILSAATEPVRRPLRYILPDLGGIDITPVALITIIVIIRYVIAMSILPKL
jgi:YggT family protein